MNVLRNLLVLIFTLFFVVNPVAEEVCRFSVVNKTSSQKSLFLNKIVDSFWPWQRDYKTIADIPLDYNDCVKVSSRLGKSKIRIAYRTENSWVDVNVCSDYYYGDGSSVVFVFEEGGVFHEHHDISLPYCRDLINIDRSERVKWTHDVHSK